MKRRGRPVKPSDPLHHPRRRLLVDLITKDPGMTFRGLVAASGIPAGTCRHHVSKLLRHGLVWEKRWGCRILHYPGRKPDAVADRMDAVRASLDPPLRVLLGAVKDHGCVNQKTIIDQFPDTPRGTIQNRIKRLVRYGFLDERPSGRHLFYSVVAI